MIRQAEAVLDGHPDRFCDLVADSIVFDLCREEPDAYAQIEVAVWSDLLILTGAAFTRDGRRPDVRRLIVELGRRIGYSPDNHIDVERYRIQDEVCYIRTDPAEWTMHVNDQCIVTGYAGYDERTAYLPPEQFLARHLRMAVMDSLRQGPLQGEGPDGKLLVILREETDGWHPETIILTVQQRPSTPYTSLVAAAIRTLREAWEDLRRHDPRWKPEWRGIRCLVNPNGPMHEAGSDADNGQTGRKTVMDFYGPRIPIGGGALHGKHPSHIDRIASARARRFAVDRVRQGAPETLVTVCYAPGMNDPVSLDIPSGLQHPDNANEYFSFPNMLHDLGREMSGCTEADDASRIYRTGVWGPSPATDLLK